MTPADDNSPTVTRVPGTYLPADISIGIVHLGLGAFHRAHQAVYIEQVLQRHGGGPWAICSANIRSNMRVVEELEHQQFSYHVAEYADQQHVTLRQINAIASAIYAGEGDNGSGHAALLDILSAATTRLVTLTVTEKGYYLIPAQQQLRLDDPAIAADIVQPQQPHTAPGLLVEALRRRRAAGIPPFTVLSCDNMPDNGKRCQMAVVQLAAQQDAGLADWIATEVAFPCSMVDRIVPAMTDASLATLRDLGCNEPAAIICEAFSQWVVEDHFPQGRPDWEVDGVQMVADVAPFEAMKLRMLNGSHSLLAYLGPLLGYATVAEAVADSQVCALLRGYMLEEAKPTLSMPADVDIDAYADQLLARFANDSLHHQLRQIAMDGSQKLPQRWLAGMQQLRHDQLPCRRTELGIAAWVMTVMQANKGLLTLNDPMQATLLAAASEADPLLALLSVDAIFPAHLVQDQALLVRLREALTALSQPSTAGTFIAQLQG